jgi:hypothetical protein
MVPTPRLRPQSEQVMGAVRIVTTGQHAVTAPLAAVSANVGDEDRVKEVEELRHDLQPG